MKASDAHRFALAGYADTYGETYHELSGGPAFLGELDPNFEIPEIPDLFTKIAKRVARYPSKFFMAAWCVRRPCGTSYCLGGWILHFAGLSDTELKTKPNLASRAALVAYASHPHLPKYPIFYAEEEVGLAYINEMAAWEQRKKNLARLPMESCETCGCSFLLRPKHAEQPQCPNCGVKLSEIPCHVETAL